MSPRGRRASVPPAGHGRPEYVTPDGLVVHHYNRAGRVKDYDFSVLPVAEPMRRSLAALFAAGCVPHRWSTHDTSRVNWYHLTYFADFLSSLDRPPSDLDGLTVAMMKRWRQAGSRSSVRIVAALLLDDARLRSGPVADEIARRTRKPAAAVQSYGEAEFEQVRLAATRMFRDALSRIEDNAAHLGRWRAGGFVRGEPEWVLGEALDMLARTGDVPRHNTSRGPSVVRRYRLALGGGSAEHTWQRLFLTRHEAVALGVLLLAQYGWNLSVIDHVEVPRALPDQGVDGRPTYRVALDKPRRGPGRGRETRNVTDDGASSPGRLITRALAATRFARAIVEDLAPGTDRLLVWRTASARTGRVNQERHPPVGPFCFGIYLSSATEWATRQGLPGSPFRRGRRTVLALDRREPAQHSQSTHDRDYVLPDKRVQAQAVEVIAAGAQDAADRARQVVLVAELRERPTPGDVGTATADCADFHAGPYPAPDGGCGASFLACLGCPNARVHPGHHPRLAHLHAALTGLRPVLPPPVWAADWGEPHARLTDLKTRLGDGQWAHALGRVGDDDRALIHDLLTGAFDT